MYQITDTEFHSGLKIEYHSISIFKVYQDSFSAIYDADEKKILSGKIRKNSDIAIVEYLIKKLEKSLS